MGTESWSLTAKLCDSCKAESAAVFCRADSAFLCCACDADIHAANKLASRHGRVWICEVCEQAPASFTCKADAAALCAACDADIHSANPLARRHERVPISPFYDAAAASKSPPSAATEECSEEEAEAASWLLPDPNSKPEEESRSPEYMSLFTDMDPYLDLDLKCKPHHIADSEHKHYSAADGVVPVQNKAEYGSGHYVPGPVVDGFPTYEMDYPDPKPFMYNFTSQSISQSVSSSSMEVGVVPEHEHHGAADASESVAAVAVLGMDREARVLRYREKRKNRRFEKTIRYASRKAYAETRPRIKGRFAKRSESLLAADASAYGVVPSF
ncbi:zinc finger protein CONSTANS-LIKE 4-like [Salvia divinorum]|uniref:Zinc finger protein CONSTANS-LIKE 4-like n=1 Tax=Salvia divinorum TaxID=28513 RepID=A0ABD1FKK3_SALDI